jgi:hypothetical protein
MGRSGLLRRMILCKGVSACFGHGGKLPPCSGSKFVTYFFEDPLSERPWLTALGEPITDEISCDASLSNLLERVDLARLG